MKTDANEVFLQSLLMLGLIIELQPSAHMQI